VSRLLLVLLLLMLFVLFLSMLLQPCECYEQLWPALAPLLWLLLVLLLPRRRSRCFFGLGLQPARVSSLSRIMQSSG
jgi:hypothetical protein